MPQAPLPENEKERLAELRRFHILDTPSDDAYDDLVSLAATLCNTPIAVISLVDESRQWFKAQTGLSVQQTPREQAFCAHVILPTAKDMLVVEDATLDPRFRDNELVTQAPGIRFYAGCPLVTRNGHALGTLCVIDTEPRTLEKQQMATLKTLARHAVALMERDKTRVECAQAQECLALTEKAANLGHWHVDLTTQSVFWSDQVYVIHGISKDAYTPTLESALHFYHPEDRERVENALHQVAREQIPDTFEARIIDGAGKMVHIKCHAMVRKQTDGQSASLFGTFQDISDKKALNISLQKTRSFNDLIVDSSNYLIITCDLSGMITSMNRAAEQALGYPALDLIGKETHLIWHDREEIEAYIRHLNRQWNENIAPGHDAFFAPCREHGPTKSRWTCRRKDGSTFRGQITTSCMRDQQQTVAGYLIIIEDITTHEQALEALQDAKAFQDLMLASNPDYIFVKDDRFRIVEANKAFLSLYPATQRDKVIGYTTLEDYNEEESREFLKYDRIAFDKGASETFETIEFPNGDTRTLFTKKIRFHNASGKAFILGIGQDVTERENLIRQLKRSNEDLDEFAYIASHDLKEPVRGIHNHIKLFYRENEHNVSGDGDRRLKRVLELTQYMETLISDLLYFSRVGRENMTRQSADLNGMVQEVIASTPLIEEDKVNVSIPSPLPVIVCDKLRLTEVFRNLVTNAIKYNDSADKTIEISASRSRIDSKDCTVLAVKDNGIGIDAEFHQSIFRIFKRLHKKDKYMGGTGAGLTFVQKIIERHHGKVWLHSSPGQGTTFFFSIPDNLNNEQHEGSV